MNVGLALNLHTHLEGWVRPQTAAELAAFSGVDTPTEGWRAAMRVSGPGDLSTYLRHVASVYPLLGSAGSLARITTEAVIDAAADGCRFLELRVGPVTHTRHDFPLPAAVEALCEGLQRGTGQSGLDAGLVMVILRHHSAEVNEELARLAVSHQREGVVGFDLAGDEHTYPNLHPHRTAFAIAREGGLGLTAHAAEAASAHAVKQARDLLGVSRIGHGTRVAEDAEVLDWAADSGLCFEVCPRQTCSPARCAQASAILPKPSSTTIAQWC